MGCSFLSSICISPEAKVKKNAFHLTGSGILFVYTNKELNDEAKILIREKCCRYIIFHHRVQNGSGRELV